MANRKMLKRVPVKQFLDTGLLLVINQILHIFGWAIVAESDDKHPDVLTLYPARCRFRGFSSGATSDAYKKVSSWMVKHAGELKADADA